jgi:hypothetical protein
VSILQVSILQVWNHKGERKCVTLPVIASAIRPSASATAWRVSFSITSPIRPVPKLTLGRVNMIASSTNNSDAIRKPSAECFVIAGRKAEPLYRKLETQAKRLKDQRLAEKRFTKTERRWARRVARQERHLGHESRIDPTRNSEDI